MSALGEHARFDAPATAAARPGRVTLVGAGPGDPELLTLKAVKALRAAQIVLHDSLVDAAVFEHVPRTAHRIAVGKRAGRHSMSQRAIIELMLRLARGGHPVLRLKGGDPFIFGRGGEEVLALTRAGIPFEVIPGVSAAQGAAACAGIPLTHRDHAAALVFATGHLRGAGDDARTVDLDWALLARPRQTTVIYMGLAALPQICEQLVAHGLPPDTPAAVVERATCTDQRTIAGTVATLPALAQARGVCAPALIVVGAVVALQRTLGVALRPHAPPARHAA
ncbi:MAG: uroporphyrinogen-III C-methyltransferase [Burkholderiaceae bacterium]|nr:uroporphyrinogen-III C-methyltransferase [Ideonella sp.]MCC7284735.1 uroporphyrinogen-III C-methyltransferase [Burkholderiaceae bacterium]